MSQGRPELNDDFIDMLDALQKESVEHVIVGAYALAAHGLPRATLDIDVLVRPSPDNAARVIRALHRFGAPVDAHGVSQSDFEVVGNVYQVGLPPRRIDILTSINGVDFDAVSSGAIEGQLGPLTVRFIGRIELIKNKRASGREKDRADVAALEAAREPEAD